jgi:hypothetical protein
MRLWPWQSLEKILEKRLEDSNIFESKRYTPEELFEELRNRPPQKFYVRWYYRIVNYLKDTSWLVYSLFNPSNERIRNAIPDQWMDLTELIRIVNFEIILQFYEEEYIDSRIEFDTEFVLWLEDAYEYITKGRINLCSEMDEELNRVYELPYKEKSYKLVEEYDKQIRDKDEFILIKMIKYRAHFWT